MFRNVMCQAPLGTLAYRNKRVIFPVMEGLMEKIVSLSKRRGFVFPGSEIYPAPFVGKGMYARSAADKRCGVYGGPSTL